MKVVFVGLSGGTHLGGSFTRAARRLDIAGMLIDSGAAFGGPPALRSLAWRFAHRPARLNRFSSEVVETCARELPDAMIALGTGALDRRALDGLRARRILSVGFSTDDPWNPAMKAAWHLAALPAYDILFTPRRANLAEFRAIGCRDVRYLPFGYDEDFFNPAPSAAKVETHDVLFVGGADRDRLAFMTDFLRSGFNVALAGGYWDRYPETRPFALGLKAPQELCAMTASAGVNLCLVRRANRDGHVMRSFEIAAAGGCMLAEDTPEHREIFGADGDAVAYFRSSRDAAERASQLLANPSERARMAGALRARAGTAEHSYSARLNAMLAAVADVEKRREASRAR